MTRIDNIVVPRWFLEVIEDTLRIQNNINLDKKTGETCQDRNIRQSLNGIRKLLNGEELTGMERLEKTQPSLPPDLDEAAGKYANREYPNEPSCGQWGTGDYEPPVDMEYPREIAKDAFKAGAEWMAGQGWLSVDEKLPEMYEEVIVLTDELGTAPIYKIAFGHIVDVERCIDYNGWNCPGVKYWMPCPEIPNND